MRYLQKFSKKKISPFGDGTKNMFYNIIANISEVILSFLFYFAYICTWNQKSIMNRLMTIRIREERFYS